MRVVFPSDAERDASCQYFGLCGGCRAQHLHYPTQLAVKSAAVAELFADIIAAHGAQYLPAVGADDEFHYRNKLEFTFSNLAYLSREEMEQGVDASAGALGFHAPRVFSKALDIDECLLHAPNINVLRNRLRDSAREQGLSFYNNQRHEGLLRNLIVRSNKRGDLLLILVLGEDKPEVATALLGELAALDSTVKGAFWVLNTKKNSSVQDLPMQHLFGETMLAETLGDTLYAVAPQAFFQTNSAQAETLYRRVDQALEQILSGRKTPVLYDLYCGAGTISLFCRRHAERIVGIEYVESAVRDAEVNAMLNGVDDAVFYAGDMAKVFDQALVAKHGQPEVVVVDPARPGMAPSVCAQLEAVAPKTIIYISCNAQTQHRDIGLLPSYRLQSLQCVDMFPQTPHTETVAVLQRVDA